jgi:hypothetical protein
VINLDRFHCTSKFTDMFDKRVTCACDRSIIKDALDENCALPDYYAVVVSSLNSTPRTFHACTTNVISCAAIVQ